MRRGANLLGDKLVVSHVLQHLRAALVVLDAALAQPTAVRYPDAGREAVLLHLARRTPAQYSLGRTEPPRTAGPTGQAGIADLRPGRSPGAKEVSLPAVGKLLLLLLLLLVTMQAAGNWRGMVLGALILD